MTKVNFSLAAVFCLTFSSCADSKDGPRGELADMGGLDLYGLDLNGLDLNGLDLYGLDLNGLDLRPALLSIMPTSATVGPLQSVQFSSNLSVDWEIQETGGGSIDAAGLYVAPEVPGIYSIVATTTIEPHQSQTVTVTVVKGLALLAGQLGGAGSLSGQCTSARFSDMSGETLIGDTLFVADEFLLRSINLSTKEVSNIALDSFGFPAQTALTSNGVDTLYFSKGTTVYSLSLSSTPTPTFIADHCGTTALTSPSGLAFAKGYLFVSESLENKVCKLDLGASPQPPIAISTTSSPVALAFDAADTIYLAPGSGVTIEMVAVSSNILGTFTLNFPLDRPADILSLGGDLYLSDKRIKRITRSSNPAMLTEICDTMFGYIDGDLSSAEFNSPAGIATDGVHTMYVSDVNNHVVREIDLSASTVDTLCGTAPHNGEVDGLGAAARLSFPSAMAFDSHDTIYFADGQTYLDTPLSNTLRKLTLSDNRVETVSPQPFAASANIDAMAFDSTSGDLYALDSNAPTSVTKLNPVTGVLAPPITFAPPGSCTQNFFGLAVDADGNLFVSDPGCSVIYKNGVPYAFGDAGSMTAAGTTLFVSLASATDHHVYSSDTGTLNLQQFTSAGFSAVPVLASDGTSLFAADLGILWQIDSLGQTRVIGTDNAHVQGIVLGPTANANLNDSSGMAYVPGLGLVISEHNESALLLYTE